MESTTMGIGITFIIVELFAFSLLARFVHLHFSSAPKSVALMEMPEVWLHCPRHNAKYSNRKAMKGFDLLGRFRSVMKPSKPDRQIPKMPN